MSRQAVFTQHIVERLEQARADIEAQWAHPVGTRTRHFHVDDFLPEALCREIYDAFPRDGEGFFNRASFREKKKTSASLGDYAPVLSEVTYALQDAAVVGLIAGICGMERIEPDPRLYAGGLSMMFKGDFLNPHIDNSHDADRGRYRRLNLLYYASPDWELACGGNFELWDDARATPKTVVSRANRLVVMETRRDSWHSVSPVTADKPRCCVSNYYFSEVSPDERDYFHVTSFTGRPEQGGRRLLGVFDNALRNAVSKLLKTGRGKSLVNTARTPER